jgi:syntaxin 18
MQIDRTAEKSLMEISELQSQLVSNLAVQSENIELLEANAINTTENVGGGNKQLQQAAERKSTAKYVFYASCGLSLFLVTWDLIF